MTRVELCSNFRDVEPAYLKARGINLLTVDVENVLTDWRVPELLPGISEHMEEILAVDGLRVALLSNSMDTDFLRRVSHLLPGKIFPINPRTAWSLYKKPDPSMFRHALKMFGADGSQAAHVDDQYRAGRGARKAGYDTFFWTKPVGEHQHSGVKLYRPIDIVLNRPRIFVANGLRNQF